MALGEDVYLSIVAQTGGTPWKIVRVKGSFGTGTFIKEKADFITCANMFNELDQASDMPPEFQSKKYYDQLCLYKNDDCKFLLVEPGVPKSARTICLLRDRFIKENYDLIGPCSHCGECPMNGFKAYTGSSHKWCNFAFSTENAPAKLLKLSENSKLTKDRATLIFISVVPNKSFDNSTVVEKNISEKQDNSISVRIISDCMKLHNNSFANYGCSKIGLVLVSSKTENAFKSGDLLKIECSQDIKKLPIDKKSGAKLISL
jgi:ribosomal protein RSM22 (predicted rRNA methylase)